MQVFENALNTTAKKNYTAENYSVAYASRVVSAYVAFSD
jgi:hypothetical protein